MPLITSVFTARDPDFRDQQSEFPIFPVVGFIDIMARTTLANPQIPRSAVVVLAGQSRSLTALKVCWTAGSLYQMAEIEGKEW